MTRHVLCLTFAAAMLAVVAAADGGDPELSLGDALTEGELSLKLRYRFESVEQSELYEDNAFASTLRTTLSYRTGLWKALQVFIEFEDVHRIGLEDGYRDLAADGGNGVDDRPVIADPEITELNQASLSWAPTRRLRLILGRQEILVDTHRFVGNVGWRQNHQSFDAGRLDLDLGARTVATYAYVGQVNRIFGDSLPMSSHLVEVAHTLPEVGTVRAYAVLLDYDDEEDAALSRDSYGVSFDGRASLAATRALRYRLEYAEQRDAGDNPGRVDADYYRADVGLELGALSFGVGYELLGGSPQGDRFLTPLATLHKFNGWADLFLSTPADGLEDLFLSIEGKLERWKLAAIWHEFSADSGSADYGRELDLQVLWTLPWTQSVGLKGAFYDADEYATDTTKLMLWTQWGFQAGK